MQVLTLYYYQVSMLSTLSRYYYQGLQETSLLVIMSVLSGDQSEPGADKYPGPAVTG